MLLVSIFENGKEPVNYSTVNSINDLYRGLCAGLDVNKFLSMSNFNLFFCIFDFNYKELVETDGVTASLFSPGVENLSDSVYEYMLDNLNVYFDIVKQIDDYREKIKNYKLDK